MKSENVSKDRVQTKKEPLRLLARPEPKNSYRILAFLIPGIILLAVYVQRGIYPFGDRGILAADLYHQYMPFLQELQEKLKTGGDLAFTWNLGIGTNFTALFTYYLASPIHFLCVFVSRSHLMEFIAFLIWLKVSLCGFTACVYFQSKGQENRGLPLLLSVLYALSGYTCAYYYNIMWLDIILVAPLVLMGLESLVKICRWKLYVLSLSYCILSNFYLSIMLCIFLVLYFVVLLICEGVEGKKLIRFAFFSGMAGAIAAVLLVPEAMFLLGSDFAEGSFPKEFTSYFSIFDVLSRQCLGVTTEKGLDHWPNIYCGVAVYLLVPLFLLNREIPMRKRFSYLALTGFLLFSFSVRNLDFIWHGLNFPDSLPARQSFLYILLVLTICYEAVSALSKISKEKLAIAVALAVGYLLLLEKAGVGEDFEDWTVLLNLVFVCAYGILLCLYQKGFRGGKRVVLFLVTLTILVTEVTANLTITSITTIDREGYLKEIDDYQILYEQAKKETEGFFRLEKFERKIKNDGGLYHIPMASTFSSTQNSAVKELYRRLGLRYSKVFYEYGGATPLVAGLLGVRYMYNEAAESEQGERENSLYTKVGSSGKVELYRNQYTLPFGICLPSGYDLPESFSGCGLELQNRMAADILGYDEEEADLAQNKLFVPTESEETGSDVVFQVKESGYYYGVMTTSKVKKLTITGGHPYEVKQKDLKKNETLEIGELAAGDTVILQNTEDDGNAVKVDVYRLNQELLSRLFETLSQVEMESVQYDETSMTIELKLTEPSRVLLPVPVENGMRVTVNGAEAQTTSFGGVLLALDLEPGKYSIEVHYTVKGLVVGCIISCLGLALFILCAALGKPGFRQGFKAESETGKKKTDETLAL